MEQTYSRFRYSATYYTQFFSMGTFLPLFSIYLESIGMSGVEIGILTAIGAFMAVISGPFWGFISDKYNRHKTAYAAMLILCLISAFFIPLTNDFSLMLIILVFFNLGQSACPPLLDGLAIRTTLSFGKIRLFGSIGFGCASGLMGFVAKYYSLSIIFYIYMAGILVTLILALTLNTSSKNKTHPLQLSDIKSLISKKYFIIFLLYGLLVGSTINGQNMYFGLLFKDIGGDIALVGIAFLLFTFSEAPFMHFGSLWIKKSTIIQSFIISTLLLILRWIFYGTIASPNMILFTFFLQGLAYTFFLLGIAEFIREFLPENVRSTAMTLFNACAFGLGGILSNYISGFIYDYFPARFIYLFYGILCIIALVIVLLLKQSVFSKTVDTTDRI